jgi:hypothetical protein
MDNWLELSNESHFQEGQVLEIKHKTTGRLYTFYLDGFTYGGDMCTARHVAVSEDVVYSLSGPFTILRYDRPAIPKELRGDYLARIVKTFATQR